MQHALLSSFNGDAIRLVGLQKQCTPTKLFCHPMLKLTNHEDICHLTVMHLRKTYHLPPRPCLPLPPTPIRLSLFSHPVMNLMNHKDTIYLTVTYLRMTHLLPQRPYLPLHPNPTRLSLCSRPVLKLVNKKDTTKV